MHHLQKAIIRNLMRGERVRFSDGRPEGTDGNIYTYHLKQLIAEGFVRKNEDGSYDLTEKGKHAAITSHLSRVESIRQAHAILLLAARREDGAWLLRKRLVQPSIGSIGFVHGEPRFDEAVVETAKTRFKAKTGLDADFEPMSHGYIKIFRGDELESFTHCTVLLSSNASGDLINQDETGSNMWSQEPDFYDSSFIPSMPIISQSIMNENTIFFDETYQI